jgi:hypothetical protein
MSARLPVFALLGAVLATAAPIQLHPENPHYFLFRGRATVLVTSAAHYGAVLNPDFEYRKYLETLAADGLNYTRIFSGSYVEAPGAFGIARNTLAPAPGRFLAPWARSGTPGYHNGGNKFDLDRWDDAYFARLKDFVEPREQCQRHGRHRPAAVAYARERQHFGPPGAARPQTRARVERLR